MNYILLSYQFPQVFKKVTFKKVLLFVLFIQLASINVIAQNKIDNKDTISKAQNQTDTPTNTISIKSYDPVVEKISTLESSVEELKQLTISESKKRKRINFGPYIAALVSLILGGLNVFYLLKISSRQRELEIKKTRIDILESRRSNIERVKSTITSRSFQISEDQLQNAVNALGYFQDNTSEILSIAHLIRSPIVEELKSLRQVTNKHTVAASRNQPLDSNEVMQVFKQIEGIDDRMKDVLEKRLVKIEEQIEELLK